MDIFEQLSNSVDNWLHQLLKSEEDLKLSLKNFLQERKQIDEYLDSTLDIKNIDYELKMISTIYSRIADLLPIFQYIKNITKMNLDAIKAELWKNLKKDKVTDKTVENQIEINEMYQDWRKKYIEATYSLDLIQQYEKKVNMRNKAIEKAIKLYELGFLVKEL